jgi:hypothetical protein
MRPQRDIDDQWMADMEFTRRAETMLSRLHNRAETQNGGESDMDMEDELPEDSDEM